MQTGKQRMGKGFSPDEIKQAGLSAADARELQVPVDRKRKTAHEENVSQLKSHWEKHKAEAKPKPAAEKPAEGKKKPKN